MPIPREAVGQVFLARVTVMLKPVVNDPQGVAIRGGLHELGYTGVSDARAGKIFELRLDAADTADAERTVDEICRRLLANPVIEDYHFEIRTAK